MKERVAEDVAFDRLRRLDESTEDCRSRRGGGCWFRVRMIERTVRAAQVGAEGAEGVAGVQRETA
jgi:hypothetical protein